MDGSTFKNKLDVWKSYDHWNFTKNDTFIENISKNKTLGTKDFNIVGIQSIFDKGENSWRLGKTRNDGYFTIKHLTSQKLLVPTNEFYGLFGSTFNIIDFEVHALGLIYKGK